MLNSNPIQQRLTTAQPSVIFNDLPGRRFGIGDPGDMRSERDILMRPKRVLLRQGFFAKDIQPGCDKLTAIKSRQQIGIDQVLPPADID